MLGLGALFKFMYYAELEHLLPGAQRGVGVRNPRFQSRLRVVSSCIGVGSTGAPGAGAPLYFFQLTSILVHLLS